MYNNLPFGVLQPNIDNSDNFYGRICLTDIDKSRIYQGKDGKAYINVSVRRKKTPSRFGDSHYIAVSATKEQSQQGQQPLNFVGNLTPSK